jgi:hypothetical protein
VRSNERSEKQYGFSTTMTAVSLSTVDGVVEVNSGRKVVGILPRAQRWHGGW